MIDWSDFKFEFTLGKQYVAELVGIEGRRRGISGWVMPYPWVAQLEKARRVRSVASTLELAGTTVPEQRISEILDDDVRTSSNLGVVSPQARVIDVTQAFTWLKEQFDYKIKQKCSLETVLELHRLSTLSTADEHNVPGRFRLYEVASDRNLTSGIHRGAPSGNLPALMDRFVEWIGSEELANRVHPVVRALIAHFFLATIQPFGQGNGRVSRFIETGLLYQAGFNVPGFHGLHDYYSQNESDYRSLLQDARNSEPFDLTEFVAFGLRGIRRDLEEILSYIHSRLYQVLYRRMLDEARLKRVSERRMVLNEREHSLLSYLLKITEPTETLAKQRLHRINLAELLDDPFTTTLYKGRTRRTIQREIDRLEHNGFIQCEKRDGEFFVAIDYDAIGKF